MVNDMPLCEKRDFGDKGDFILMLGGACNMRCRHCAQMPVREEGVGHCVAIAPKVMRMMDNYVRYALGRDDRQRHIYFYGGEALLYWDTIRDVVMRFAREYDLFATDAFRFGLQSNGLLLTRDKVDFMNTFGIGLGFSYDAPYPFAVRGYVPDCICELVKEVETHSIVPTCSNAYNYDMLLAYRCLKAKFPNAKSIRNTFNLSFSFDMPEDIYAYDWERFGQAMRKLRIAAQLGDRYALDWFKMYFRQICSRKPDVPDGFRVASCLLEHAEIPVTADGRYSACQNGDFFFGTVDDSLDGINERIRARLEKSVSPECAGCAHRDICRIHCQLDMRNPDGSYVTCRRYWWPLFSLIKKEMLKLSEPLSDEDRVWFAEQEKVMDGQVEAFLSEGKRFARERTRLPKGFGTGAGD